MPFEKYTSRQLRELTATLMRLKFLSPVSEETYSPMLNSLLRDIKDSVSERPTVDPDRDRVLGVFAHFADDRRIREILVDLETEHYMKERWTHESIRGELSAAIFPMNIREDQWEWIEPELLRIVSSQWGQTACDPANK